MFNNARLLEEPATVITTSQRIVIPVRYVADGEIVHATSNAVSADDVHVSSARPPKLGSWIGLKLYFPDGGGVVSRKGVVADSLGNEFRAEFRDSDELAHHRLSELLWQRDIGIRPYPRFHTNLKAVVREPGRATSNGYVTNLSRSGAFVKLESLPPQGSVVELELEFPERAAHDMVHAYVVHVAPRRGVGVKFIGASDAFALKLEEYLARLAR